MSNQQDEQQDERISFSGKVLRVAVVTLITFFLVLLLWFAIHIPLLFFAGVVMATFIRSMSSPLSRLTRLPQPISIILVVLALVGAVWLSGVYLAPQVGKQFDVLKSQLPAAVGNLEVRLRETTIGNEMLSRLPSISDLLKNKRVLKELRSFFSVTLGFASGLFIFLFAGIYLMFDPDVYIRGIIRLVPVHYEERAANLFKELATTLRRWILGRLTSMAAVGLITGVGLWLLGVPLALTLGLLSGFLTFIPYLGAIISAVPAVLLALLAEPVLAVWVVLLYLGAHGVEAYIVTPLMQQRQVHMPPVLTLMMQILMGYAAGLLGLTLATPLVAMLLVLVKVLYVEDALGKKPRLAGAKEQL